MCLCVSLFPSRVAVRECVECARHVAPIGTVLAPRRGSRRCCWSSPSDPRRRRLRRRRFPASQPLPSPSRSYVTTPSRPYLPFLPLFLFLCFPTYIYIYIHRRLARTRAFFGPDITVLVALMCWRKREKETTTIASLSPSSRLSLSPTVPHFPSSSSARPTGRLSRLLPLPRSDGVRAS